MCFKPGNPYRPPRTILVRSLGQVGFRIDIAIGRFRGHDLEAATITAGLRHDPDIMAAGREQISHVGVSHKINLVRGRPRRDVVAQRANREDRGPNVRERDRLAGDDKSSLGKIVV